MSILIRAGIQLVAAGFDVAFRKAWSLPAMGQQQVQGPCASDKEMFFDCLKQNKGDQDSCSFLYQQLQSCQRNETTFG